jgi:hypothetical protein
MLTTYMALHLLLATVSSRGDMHKDAFRTTTTIITLIL